MTGATFILPDNGRGTDDPDIERDAAATIVQTHDGVYVDERPARVIDVEKTRLIVRDETSGVRRAFKRVITNAGGESHLTYGDVVGERVHADRARPPPPPLKHCHLDVGVAVDRVRFDPWVTVERCARCGRKNVVGVALMATHELHCRACLALVEWDLQLDADFARALFRSALLNATEQDDTEEQRAALHRIRTQLAGIDGVEPWTIHDDVFFDDIDGWSLRNHVVYLLRNTPQLKALTVRRGTHRWAALETGDIRFIVHGDRAVVDGRDVVVATRIPGSQED